MTIGILLPLSAAHPGITKDFMDGFESLLAQKQIAESITIKKESIGFGGAEKEVYAKAEKLLVSDDVDILVAYIDEKVTSMLYSLVQATGKLVLLVNPGANHPLNWIAQPTVIHINLQHAFLCWLTGGLAAESANKNAAYASSFYDCGYLHSADMVRNFMASGGSVVNNYINNQAYDDNFEINQLADFLSANPACTDLLCVYDELPASLFYNRLNSSQKLPTLNLFVSPMMLTVKALAKCSKEDNYSIHGYLPWQFEKDTVENKIFTQSCSRAATMFSLLGWETALVVGEIIQNFKNSIQDGEAVVSHLKESNLHGPRGEMTLDAETLFYTVPVGKFIKTQGSDISLIEWDIDIKKEWQRFSAIETEGTVTGWTNTYLCY